MPTEPPTSDTPLSDAELNAKLAVQRQIIEYRLRHLFRKTLDLPHNQELFNLILRFRLGDPA